MLHSLIIINLFLFHNFGILGILHIDVALLQALSVLSEVASLVEELSAVLEQVLVVLEGMLGLPNEPEEQVGQIVPCCHVINVQLE